jgi:hypothetical protein
VATLIAPVPSRQGVRKSKHGDPCPSCAPHPVRSWFRLARDLMLSTKRYGWSYFEGVAPACK